LKQGEMLIVLGEAGIQVWDLQGNAVWSKATDLIDEIQVCDSTVALTFMDDPPQRMALRSGDTV
jgi:hypothetical protein